MWTVTSGLDAAAAHVFIDDDADLKSVLTGLHTTLVERYKVVHATIQIEPKGFEHSTTSI